MHSEYEALITPVFKLNRDITQALKQSGGGITDNEARFLVDIFYTMQDQRVRANNQVKGLDRDADKSGNDAEPHDALDWTLTQFKTLELQIEKLLTIYVSTHPMAWFFEQTVGIGGILAAGLLAHIDIRKAPTAGHIWNFAGLNPDITWEKKTRRPWNADLKKIAWKIGDSFVKQSSHPRDFYGQIYRQRKVYEWDRNINGAMAEQATHYLNAKKYGTDTDARAWYSGACSPDLARASLEAGKTPTAAACKAAEGVPMLPPAQIDMRARRYAVKLFLSHLQQRWWETEFHAPPPKPFAIGILGHAHVIDPPQVNPVTMH
ncbi:MAG: hypothetical protein KAX46_03045 [Chromatiaceae bacterium]|nr:hypothetical protein [Chromatiaceae bacterium]